MHRIESATYVPAACRITSIGVPSGLTELSTRLLPSVVSDATEMDVVPCVISGAVALAHASRKLAIDPAATRPPSEAASVLRKVLRLSQEQVMLEEGEPAPGSRIERLSIVVKKFKGRFGGAIPGSAVLL